ncbi:MAG: hypothetical protein OFPI_37270 [Osedax symbiont Rs2]|nr:MAG: hypothetical protein OFPI_37270 [Osedax symbiont Rs2]
MTNLKRLAIIALFAILATACGTQKPISNQDDAPVANKDTGAKVDSLLLRAQTAPTVEAAQLKLAAAKLMLLQKKHIDLLNLLNLVASDELPGDLQFSIALVKAKAAIGLSDGPMALKYLNEDSQDEAASDVQLKDKYSLLASAYGLVNQLSQEAAALVTVGQYTTDRQVINPLNEKIWSVFKTLELEELTKLEQQEDNSYALRGWLALFIGFKETPFSEKLVANSWLKSWGSHLAAKFPPQQLAAYLSKEPLHNSSYSYNHVAIALPKKGKYANAAAAVLKGIKLAAQNNVANSNIQISYIDTAIYNSGDAILDQAKLLGVDAVIGPLDKTLVSQLAQMSALPLPVLALNNTAIGNSNLYQFALTTEDEVRDAAAKAYADGRRSMLILVPDNDKGILAASVFSNQFNSLGGLVVSNTYYDTAKGNLTDSIAQMLQLNQVKIRRLQKKLKTLELRKAIRKLIRKDADGIFLLASAADAYQIGPSIGYFYADHLPLYATSRIYAGRENPVRDEDLNGMMFGDLPWVLSESSNKQQMAALSNKTETRFGRLFAFGIDALNIAPNLYDLATQSHTSYTGETGELTISPDNFVQKKLHWAKFVDGTPQLLPVQ